MCYYYWIIMQYMANEAMYKRAGLEYFSNEKALYPGDKSRLV